MSRVRAALAVGLATLGGLAGMAARPGAAGAAVPEVLALRTVPAVAGLHLSVAGRSFVTDRRGETTLLLPPDLAARADGYLDALASMRVRPKQLPDGGVARFERLYSSKSGGTPIIQVALSTYYRIRPAFADLDGRPVADRMIQSYTLKSRHGVRTTVRGAGPVTLQSSRVVPFTGALVSKQIDWTVEQVKVEGADVVNRAQQRFFPSRLGGRLDVRLLFYPVRFRAHDAIFRFPIGSGIRIVKPDGERVRVPFGDGATVRLDRLPRGLYQVSVDAPGFSFQRPVALSRPQQVDLEVISYLDLIVVGALLGGLALLLLAARRPAVRRRLRHPLRRGTGVAAAVALGLVLAGSLAGGPPPAQAAAAGTPTKLFAYYYIWFTPSSWNRAKKDYPLLGHYSSDEVSIMRRHVRLAKAAGIDGFFVSWKDTPVLDERLVKLIRVARQEHFKLAIIYQGLDHERRPLPVQRIAADLDRLRARYARGPVFDVFGKPLVIWSGTWEFSRRQVHRVTDGRRGKLLILASERRADDYLAKADAFDGDAYYWSSVNPDTYPDYPGKLKEMATAVHGTGGLWIPPASPGFDARMIGGTTVVPRKNGQTLRLELDVAQQADPDAIGLISWNEFTENSHVEPSVRYGTTALKTLADVRGAHLDVGDELDSSQPVSRAAGPGALASLVVALAAFGGGMWFLTARRRRGPPADDTADEPGPVRDEVAR